MRRIFLRLFSGWLIVGSALAQPATTDPLAPQYVNSREIVLSFMASADPPPVRTELWVSRDDGRAWIVMDHEATAAGALRVRVPEDGRYGFYLVVENAAGRSDVPPTAGARPHALVVVDTAPPVLQLHSARVAKQENGTRCLRFELSLLEEHLSEAAVRVFYRTSGTGRWFDGGVLSVCSGYSGWVVPEGAGSRLDVCIAATDRAGNRAVDELRGIDLPRDAPRTQARAAVSAGPEQEPAVEDPDRATPAGDEARTPQPPAPSTADASATIRARKLRLLAQEYAAEGRLALAAARLEDGLSSLPGDPDLLAELGGVLYRAQRYEEARKRYEELLSRYPDHVGAIEGLALVAVTQRRYAEARDHLERLLVLAPETATHWLRYGDVQYQLGERDEALRAWRRVLEIKGAGGEIRRRAALRVDRLGPARQ